MEWDPEIVALVSRVLPFPDPIDVRVGDEELERAEAARYDLIIAGVCADAVMPAGVAAPGFARAAARAGKARCGVPAVSWR